MADLQAVEQRDQSRENAIEEALNLSRFLGNVLTTPHRLELNEQEMAGLGLIFQQIDEKLEP